MHANLDQIFVRKGTASLLFFVLFSDNAYLSSSASTYILCQVASY